MQSYIGPSYKEIFSSQRTEAFLGLPERAEDEFHLSVCFSAILQVSFSIKYIILVTTNSGHVSHSLL